MRVKCKKTFTRSEYLKPDAFDVVMIREYLIERGYSALRSSQRIPLQNYIREEEKKDLSQIRTRWTNVIYQKMDQPTKKLTCRVACAWLNTQERELEWEEKTKTDKEQTKLDKMKSGNRVTVSHVYAPSSESV